MGVFEGGYTARDVSRLVGLSVAEIQAYVKAGFLSPRQGSRGELRFALPDLVVLRTARELEAHIPARKLRKALRQLRDQLPSGRTLSGVRITAEGDRLVVREGGRRFEADSGQALLDFDVAPLGRAVAPLARRAAERARVRAQKLTAAEWYALGCELEAGDTAGALDAYESAVALDPGHVESHINLGRLRLEAGETDAAEQHFRRALEARPDDATAAFNLAVVFEDLGRDEEAARAYEAALAVAPDLADAHFNLSRLLERRGDAAGAFRHLKRYRELRG